uniref:Uncharacterized protein n=1 Tax=Oryza meridionalis TaxID=40149 RepID=A0A0E0DGK1_9ORYZ
MAVRSTASTSSIDFSLQGCQNVSTPFHLLGVNVHKTMAPNSKGHNMCQYAAATGDTNVCREQRWQHAKAPMCSNSSPSDE